VDDESREDRLLLVIRWKPWRGGSSGQRYVKRNKRASCRERGKCKFTKGVKKDTHRTPSKSIHREVPGPRVLCGVLCGLGAAVDNRAVAQGNALTDLHSASKWLSEAVFKDLFP